jgi:predicted esterase
MQEHSETQLPYSRMVLSGFSQGGAMSLFVGLQARLLKSPTFNHTAHRTLAPPPVSSRAGTAHGEAHAACWPAALPSTRSSILLE